MKREHMKAYKDRLLALRARFCGDICRMSESVVSSVSRRSRISIHAAQGAGNHFDQDMAARLLATKGETLQQIELALEKIEDGTYGVCGECGRAVTKVRLNAVPYATECVRCAKEGKESDMMVLTSQRNEVSQCAARVVKDARHCLTRSHYRPLHGISCDYHEGILFLRGHVTRYYHKQLAQEAVRKVVGVDEIINVIEVSM